jgi:O-antigen/teichoic acid export membrane protein
LLRYSLSTALSALFSGALVWADRFIVGAFLPAQDVGIYQAIAQTSVLFMVILNGLNEIVSPLIADLYSQDKIAELEETFRVSTKWGLYLSLPIFLVLLIFPETFLQVVFGSEYVAGSIPMVVLAFTQMVNVGTGAVGYLLMMTDFQDYLLRLTAIAVGLNISLNITLVPRFGLMGAAIASGIAVSFLFLFGLNRARISLRVWPYDRRYLKGLVAAIVAGLCGYGVQALNFFSGPVSLIVGTLVIGLVFVIILLLLGLDREDIAFLRSTGDLVKGLSKGRR